MTAGASRMTGEKSAGGERCEPGWFVGGVADAGAIADVRISDMSSMLPTMRCGMGANGVFDEVGLVAWREADLRSFCGRGNNVRVAQPVTHFAQRRRH